MIFFLKHELYFCLKKCNQLNHTNITDTQKQTKNTMPKNLFKKNYFFLIKIKYSITIFYYNIPQLINKLNQFHD